MREASKVPMLLKNMVGPCGLEPQTSTVSTRFGKRNSPEEKCRHAVEFSRESIKRI